MANFGPLLFSILSLLLLANIIIASGSGGGGSGNGNEENERPDRSVLWFERRFLLSLGPCLGGVSNDACCKAIENGIGFHGCSCVCKVLLQYGAPALITNCTRCAKCKECPPCHNSPPLRGTVGKESPHLEIH